MMNWLHRTIGLFLGAWLTLVGLSGACLVYREEIDAWLNKDLMIAAAATAQPDFDGMFAMVQAAYPDRVVLFFQRYGNDPRESAPFALSAPGADAATITDVEPAAQIEVFVDPSTMKIIGARPFHTWYRKLRSFHMELLVPGSGERTLGAIGAVVLTTVIAGIVLWWRDNRKRIARGLQLRLSSPRPRLLRDLHTVPAIYISVFLVAQVTTGILVCDWFQVRTFFARLTGDGPATPARPPATDAPPRVATSANAARDLALTVHPASDVVMIRVPLREDGRYSVRLYPTDQSRTRHMRQIEISARTGKILMRFDADDLSGPQAFMNLWMILIHKGQFLGWPGRIIVLVTGLTLSTLFPTGLYIWNRKRKSRKPAAL